MIPKIKNFRWDIFFFTSLVLLLIFLVKSDLDKLGSQQEQSHKLILQLDEEGGKRTYLKSAIKGMDDLDQVELVARSKLGLIRPGETAYKIIYNR